MKRRLRVTVLISGSGTNLQALIDAIADGRIEADIVGVISNVSDARGLQRAQQAGIPVSVLEHGRFPDRAEFDRALALLIGAGEPDLVILAGFMRIVGKAVLQPYAGRMINLHPSLLPRYRGTDTYRRALEAGDSRHGASIHFVTGELDGGPVLAQAVIPIDEGDDARSLAARLAPVEHRLIVASVAFLSRHDVEIRDDTIYVDGKILSEPLRLTEDDRLAA